MKREKYREKYEGKIEYERIYNFKAWPLCMTIHLHWDAKFTFTLSTNYWDTLYSKDRNESVLGEQWFDLISSVRDKNKSTWASVLHNNRLTQTDLYSTEILLWLEKERVDTRTIGIWINEQWNRQEQLHITCHINIKSLMCSSQWET